MKPEIANLLSTAPLFQGLATEHLEQVAGIAVERTFTRGATIFTEGDPGNGFYIVADGRVKVFKLSADGKEQVLHLFGPGSPFGEVPVFAGRRFPANATAIAKSRLLFFPRQAFVDLITAQPALALNMLAVLSIRLREFTVQIENLALKEVPGRLAAYLVALAETQGNRRQVTLTISKTLLASMLGTIPETLSRMQAKLVSEGLIRVEGRVMARLDFDGLRELAERGKLGETN